MRRRYAAAGRRIAGDAPDVYEAKLGDLRRDALNHQRDARLPRDQGPSQQLSQGRMRRIRFVRQQVLATTLVLGGELDAPDEVQAHPVRRLRRLRPPCRRVVVGDGEMRDAGSMGLQHQHARVVRAVGTVGVRVQVSLVTGSSCATRSGERLLAMSAVLTSFATVPDRIRV